MKLYFLGFIQAILAMFALISSIAHNYIQTVIFCVVAVLLIFLVVDLPTLIKEKISNT